MVFTRKALFQQGLDASPILHPAEDVRMSLAGALWTPDGSDPVKVRSGRVHGPGVTSTAVPMTVSTPSSSTLRVTAGRWVVQGLTALSGAYWGTLDAQFDRAIPGASLPAAGQFKAGILILRVYDKRYGDVQDGWDIEALLGASAATVNAAVYPSLLGTVLELRRFTIDSAGTITLGVYGPVTAPYGADVHCTSDTKPANPYLGMTIYEGDSFLRSRWDGASWEILGWLGAANTSAQGVPQASLIYTAPVVAHNVASDMVNWSTVTLPTVGTQALFSYVSNAFIRCLRKGKVRVRLYCFSDHTSAGRSKLGITMSRQNGVWSSELPDTRLRTTGFPAAGQIEQYVYYDGPVQPNDQFGAKILQTNAAATAAQYNNVILTVEYY
jgi:hypothetical protein